MISLLWRDARRMRDAYLRGLSSLADDWVSSELFARLHGATVDGWIMLTTPAQQGVAKLTSAACRELNLPLRSDVTNLARRLTNLEMLLDDLDAKVDELLGARSGQRASRNGAVPAPAPAEQSDVVV